MLFAEGTWIRNRYGVLGRILRVDPVDRVLPYHVRVLWGHREQGTWNLYEAWWHNNDVTAATPTAEEEEAWLILTLSH